MLRVRKLLFRAAVRAEARGHARVGNVNRVCYAMRHADEIFSPPRC